MTSRTQPPGDGASTTSTMTCERLLEALEQWNRHDLEGVMRYFAQDCEYHASFGPTALGASYVGRDQVREGVRSFFAAYPDGHFIDTEVAVDGDRGSAEWTFVSTNADGERTSVRGCDLLEFEGPFVRRKNAFRKVVDDQPQE